jgi:hypothetical protein
MFAVNAPRLVGGWNSTLQKLRFYSNFQLSEAQVVFVRAALRAALTKTTVID